MNPVRTPWIISIIVAICCLATWSINTRLQSSWARAGTWDIPIFISYADQFLTTGQLYDRNLAAYAPNAAVYKFPPLSGSILVALMKIGITEATIKIAGAFLQITCFFGGIFWLALTLLPHKRVAAGLLTLCLCAALLPTLEENLLRLQLEPALLFLSITAAICIYKDKDFLAGFMIGIAAMLKIYPVMAMLYFIASKKWVACYGFAIGVVIASAITFFILGFQEHYFYISSVLPILLAENPITDAENISMSRLLLLTNIDTTHLKIGLKFILASQLLSAFCLIHLYRKVKDKNTNRLLNILIFSLFIPFTLAGMNNTFWNYQLLLALPITVSACILLNNWITLSNKPDYQILGGLLLILCYLHVTAAMTVDDQFYSAQPIHMIVALVSRIFIPFFVIAVVWKSTTIITQQKSPPHY